MPPQLPAHAGSTRPAHHRWRFPAPSPSVRWGWGLGLAMAMGLALRIVYLHQIRGHPLFEAPVLDAATYARLAEEMWHESGSVAGRAYFRPPLYPLLLGLLARIGVEGSLPITLVQMGMGLATAALAGVIGRKIAGPGVGVGAAMLVALNPIFPFFEGQRLITPLYTLLATALAAAVIGVRGPVSPGRSLGVGLLAGATVAARPNGLVLLPPAAAILLRRAGGMRARAGLAFALGVAVPLAPIAIRNAVVGSEWVLVSTNGGVNLYIGNRVGSDGMTAVPPGSAWERYVIEPNRAAGRPLTAQERSRYWTEQAVREICAHPTLAVTLVARKLAAFWTAVEVPNNLEFAYVARAAPVLDLPFWPGMGAVAPLALAGAAALLTERRRRRTAWGLIGFVLAHWIGLVPFFVCSRYRTPAVPLLSVLAAVGAQALFATLRSVRSSAPPATSDSPPPPFQPAADPASRPRSLDRLGTPRAARPAPLLAGLAAGLMLGPGNLARAPRGPDLARGLYWEAVAHTTLARRNPARAADHLAHARGALDRALELDPANPDALLLRGQVTPPDADPPPRHYYEEAVARSPGFLAARLALGRECVRQGDLRSALVHVDVACHIDPFHLDALAQRAAIRAQLGDAEGALEDGLRLAELAPEQPVSWRTLAEIQRRNGDEEAAVASLARARALERERGPRASPALTADESVP